MSKPETQFEITGPDGFLFRTDLIIDERRAFNVESALRSRFTRTAGFTIRKVTHVHETTSEECSSYE